MKNENLEQKNNSNCQIRKYFEKAKPHCKKVISSKIFIALFFTLVGVCGTVLAKNKDSHQFSESFPTFPDRYDKEFSAFFNDDIFSEMRQMQERIDKIFLDHQNYMSKVLSESDNNNSTKTYISKKEDDENYYYELNFAGLKKEDIVVIIKDNNLTFSAEKKSAKSENKNQEQYASNFYYSFSIPKINQKVEPQIIKEENKIIVTLKK